MTASDPGSSPIRQTAAAPQPLNENGSSTALDFAFLLVPGFSQIAFASAIEPLRMANMVLSEPGFTGVTCSPDGQAVVASNGVHTAVDHGLDDLPRPHALFVCGPNPIVFPDERRLIHALRHMARQGSAIGGVDTGSYLLARAGLLDGFRCTIHWQDLPKLTTEFPRIIASEYLFEIDRGRYTCSGGTAAMDMMIQLIGETAPAAAPAVADLLVHERVRDRRDRQRIPLRHRVGAGQERLSGAVALMEANIEEPMQLGEISACVGVSERQLERLFESHLAATPTGFYMGLRLARARRLILNTAIAVSEVAERCGFTSPAHFSRRYRAWFGLSPRADRAGKASEAD